MSSLYDEAIADAKELVRMAEENATNKLIEAVAPRIRKIVEKKLIKEISVREDDDLNDIVASLDGGGEDNMDPDLDSTEDMNSDDMDSDDDMDFDDMDSDDSSFDLGGE